MHPVMTMAEEIAADLMEYQEIKRFKQVEEQVGNSMTVKGYIANIKRKQKELVHAKHTHRKAYIANLEADLARLQREMEELPIVMEYQQLQVDINEIMQFIQTILGEAISEKLNIIVADKTTPVPRGCGNGGPCGCSK